MAVTIKDVAAAAGVSPSTVSRTCKDSPSISRETKERVRRIMAQLGYVPNFETEPVEAFSKTIGIILPSSQRDVYETQFHLEIIRGSTAVLQPATRIVNTVITGQDDAEVLDAIQSMVSNSQEDGFILLYSKKNCPVASYLRNEVCFMSLSAKQCNPPTRPSTLTTTMPLPEKKPPIIFMNWDTAALLISVSATPCCFLRNANAATRCLC